MLRLLIFRFFPVQDAYKVDPGAEWVKSPTQGRPQNKDRMQVSVALSSSYKYFASTFESRISAARSCGIPILVEL